LTASSGHDPDDEFEVSSGGTIYRLTLPQHATDYIQKKVATSGSPYEEEMLTAMRGRLHSGDLVLDIGANVGNHTIYLAAVAKCRVVAFEPNRALTEALERSVVLNGLTDEVTVHSVAVGRLASKGKFAVLDEANLGGQSVAVEDDGDFDVITLDSFPLPGRVAAIKIDVEGMEPDVLAGAHGLIERDKPLVYVECIDLSSFDETVEWARAAGYYYLATYNATPTHLFRAGERSETEQEQSEAAIQAVRAAYRLSAELRDVREAQDATALKYRELAQAYSKLRDATLADMRARNVTLTERIATLSERIETLERKESSLTIALNRVRGEAFRFRDERDAQSKRARAFRAQDLATRKVVAEVRRELETTQTSLRKLRRTRAVRLSRLLRDARRSWRKALRLPFDMARLAWPARRKAKVEKKPTAKKGRALKRRDTGTGTAKNVVTSLATQRAFNPEQLAEQSRSVGRAAARLRSVTGSGRSVRVAAIVDDFTRQSLSLECDFLDVHPETWQRELEEFQPDLLFVESAWRGHGGSWHNSVSKLPPELLDILEWCRAHEIATIFWNKEDPVHFETFLRAAARFDHVFTTDLDRLADYRRVLGHGRVRYLGFACQPRIQNPIETRRRKDALVFAGGYYVRYAERMRDLEAILEGAEHVLPVDIYDRMLGTTLQEYAFPDRYRPHIVGTLDPSQIERAYKGYSFALNLNSVKSSQTMFARRAYELLSSGTVTISNYAHGLRTIFGDLVPMSDSAEGTRAHLTRLVEDRLYAERLRIMGLRKAHGEHTYADRLSYVVAVAAGLPFSPRTQEIAVVAEVGTADEARRVLATIRSQRGVRAVPVFVTADEGALELLTSESVKVVDRDEAAHLTLERVAPGVAALAVFSPSDWYGEHYLQDVTQAWLYSDADLAGKSDRFAVEDDAPVEVVGSGRYRKVADLLPRRSVVRTSAVSSTTLGEWLDVVDSASLPELTQFAVHALDYCEDGAHLAPGVTGGLAATLDVDQGVEMADLYERVDDLSRQADVERDLAMLRLQVLPTVPSDPDVESVGAGVVNGAYRVVSTLSSDSRRYLWRGTRVPVETLWEGGERRLYVHASGDLDLRLALRFFSAQGKRVGNQVFVTGRNHEVEVPGLAATVELGVRALGPGTGWVWGVYLQAVQVEPDIVRSTERALVVTDNYPSYADLYRNGFVHARLRAYTREGLKSDVFRLRSNDQFGYHEFEGQEVVTGSTAALSRLLEQGSHTTVMVHFLSPAMWSVLRNFQESHRIVIWVHGAEVQPWWRRAYNYDTPEALEAAKPASDARLDFWRGVLDDLGSDTHFVFVSQYFADEVSEDLERTFPPDQVSIVHNPIDTEIFDYVPKAAASRKKILSIRPFASAKYANDLSVAAVLDLAREPWFHELDVRFVGDGHLFEETLAPLRDLPNVTIEQGFLDQRSIADLHKEYGVFLVPTRMDAQGVSKDEAMASGLVPVTSDVAAIPEFVDGDVGYLAPYDDFVALADAIRDMYHHPEEFLRRSKAAAERARRQTSADVVVPRELDLIRGTVAVADADAVPARSRDRRIAVLGSCVSRDMFEFYRDRISPPVAYFARSSLASAMCPEPFTGVDTSTVESAFQRRVVEYDLSGEFQRYVVEGDFDILLVDLIDERFDLLRRGDALATRSNEFVRASVDEEGLVRVPALSEKYYELWQSAWAALVRSLRDADRLDRLRVNEAYWTERVADGSDLPANFPRSVIEANNAFLSRLYLRMADDLEEWQFLRYPPGTLAADSVHKWGPAPFHYAKSAYGHLLQRLSR